MIFSQFKIPIILSDLLDGAKYERARSSRLRSIYKQAAKNKKPKKQHKVEYFLLFIKKNLNFSTQLFSGFDIFEKKEN